MLYFGVKGAILWGILITWVLGIVAELTGWYVVDVEAGVYSVIPQITAQPISCLTLPLWATLPLNSTSATC